MQNALRRIKKVETLIHRIVNENTEGLEINYYTKNIKINKYALLKNMATLVRIFITLFIFIGIAVPFANALYRKYLSLVFDVRKYYGASNVCFITPHKNQYTIEDTVGNILSRELSQNGIMTLIVNADEMVLCTTIGSTRADRPLVFMLLTTNEDVNDLIKYIKTVKISFPIWLLIFVDAVDPSICNYCSNPTRNILGLLFNTEMLVLCCKDPLVKEWWSLHDNKTKTSIWGKWTVQDRLKILDGRSLYGRRYEINGTGIRVAIVTQDSDIVLNEDGTLTGFFGDILMELKRVMNFEITAILKGDTFGSWNSVTQSWSGVIDLIRKGKADIAVAKFTVTNHRLDIVDFTLPLLASRTQLYVKERDGSKVQWTAHFKAFTLQIWMTIIILAIASTVLVALMKMRAGLYSFPHLFVEHYLYVWGIFCQQGLAAFPIETPLRIAYCSIFASAIVVSAAYSASLISFITVSSTIMPFSSVEGFANDGSYRLIVLQNSSDWDLFNSSPDPIMEKMKKLLKPWETLPRNMDEGFEQVCSEKVAFFTSRAMVMTAKNYYTCKVVYIDTGSIDSLAMVMPLDSEYTGIVNYHVQRFEDRGVMSRLKQMHLKTPMETDSILTEVTLWGVAPILSVLAGGIVLALIILLCEKFYKFLLIRKKVPRDYFGKRLLMKNKNKRCFNNKKMQSKKSWIGTTTYYNNSIMSNLK